MSLALMRLALLALFAAAGFHAGTFGAASPSLAATQSVNGDRDLDPGRAIRLAVIPWALDRTGGLEARHAGDDAHRSRLSSGPEALNPSGIGTLAFSTSARNASASRPIVLSDRRRAFDARGPPHRA